MTQALVDLADQHRYQDLFIKQLRWSAPDVKPQIITLTDGTSLTLHNASTYKGIRVWVCDQLPGAKAEVEVDKKLAATSTDRLVIFHNDDEQIWRWPVRREKGHTTTTRLARHRHRAGATDPGFAHRLAAIQLPTDTVLDATAVLTRVREAFDVERQNETKHASKLMVAMYTAIEKAYPADYDRRKRDHEISVTLARILFLMFGDDTDMWRPDAFRDHLLQNTTADGANLQLVLQQLFDQLNDPTHQSAAPLPYVNGGIFRESVTLPPISADFRKAVLTACEVDWSTISPAIFGSMFQSVRDAATRRALGEHYTSEENILKTLNPLFLDELRASLAKATTAKALNKLWDRLGKIRFMDPACGCGNFIIVAYRELRDLELQIMERLKDLHYKGSAESQLEFVPTLALKVSLNHFYGIEIDEWPARIAETAMFLMDRQCDLKLKERFGDAPKRLPIRLQATIVVGNALRVDWSSVLPASGDVVVAGNPPFKGTDLTDDQIDDARYAWGADYDARLDYVTAWHAKTLDYFRAVDSDWAFVSTNSAFQGLGVPALFDPLLKQGWRIKFAHRTFPWRSEASNGAAVHCSIVGFTRTKGTRPNLMVYDRWGALINESTPENINPYLLPDSNVLVRKRSKPLPGLPFVNYGSKPADGRGLLLKPAERQQALEDPIAARYVRPYIGADELLGGGQRWCLWLVDAPASDLRTSPFIANRLEIVRRARSGSTKLSTKLASETPHLFTEIRQPHTGYLAIPRHFSDVWPYLAVAWFDQEVICGDANFTAPDPDGYLFALISSSMFLAWQKMIGGRIKSDPRFSNTVVWNNFPMPKVSQAVRENLISAGRLVLSARETLESLSLEDMYDSPPPSLSAAHESLDDQVDAAFGLPKPATGSALGRQATLFARYREIVAPA